MFSKLKDMVLSLSGSYAFYKNKYGELLNANTSLEKKVEELTVENRELKRNFDKLLSNQENTNNLILNLKENDEEQLNLLRKGLSSQKVHSSYLCNVLESNGLLLSNQKMMFHHIDDMKGYDEENNSMLHEVTASEKNNSQLVNEILDINSRVLLNHRNLVTYFENLNFNNNIHKELLEDISSSQQEFKENQMFIKDKTVKIEKTASYSQIKMDSKFNQHQRFVKTMVNNLKPSLNNEQSKEYNNELNISKTFADDYTISLNYDSGDK